MCRTLLVHHQGEQYLYTATAKYIDLLHVEALLEILRRRICIADRIVHLNLL